jgi:hypothetical protein
VSSIVEALGHVHVGLTRDVAVLVEALVQLLRYDELTEHDTLGEEIILGAIRMRLTGLCRSSASRGC